MKKPLKKTIDFLLSKGIDFTKNTVGTNDVIIIKNSSTVIYDLLTHVKKERLNLMCYNNQLTLQFKK